MKIWFVLFGLIVSQRVSAQDTTTVNDTVHYDFAAYLDTYIGFNTSQDITGTAPYFVSHNSLNQVGINVAFLSVSFNHRLVRGKLTPGFGTYFNENYAQEKAANRMIMEANVGFALSPKRGIWLDAGVLPSPYTNETAVSKDHLCYSRALAGEYVPYYLTGVRLTVPLADKFTLYAAYYNGWQQITDKNNRPAGGLQVEYRPNAKNLISVDAYAGDERYANDPSYRMRYLIDAYWLYNMNGKWSASACAYWGMQETTVIPAKDNAWYQANVALRRTFKNGWSLSGRAELFSDPNLAILPYQTYQSHTNTVIGSGTISVGKKMADIGLLRLEGRYFYSNQQVFDKGIRPDAFWGLISFTAWLNKKGHL